MPLDDIDFGPQGSAGPFVQWNAKESVDGSFPGRTWTLRTKEEKLAFKAWEGGVVLDIEAMKTGWCFSTGQAGQAPEWKWNESLSKFGPQPPDRGLERWKRGFAIPLAYGRGKDDYAVWEQAQAGSWQAFVALIGIIKAASPKGAAGQLPMLRQIGVEKIESSKGITFAPRFEIVRWVDRPAALAADAPAVDVGTDDAIPNFR